MLDNDNFIKVPKSYARVLGRMGLPEFKIIQEDDDGIGITAPKAYCDVLLRTGAVGFKEFTDTNYVFRKATSCSYADIEEAVLANQSHVTVSQTGNNAVLTVLINTLTAIASPYTGETKKYVVMLVRTNFDTIIGAKFGNKTLAQADVDAATAMGGTAKDIVWWVDAEAINGTEITRTVSKAGYSTETISIRAKKNCSIAYMDGSTPITGLTPAYYIEGVETDLPAGATKEHYVFNGWYNNAEFTGEAMLKIPASATGNKTFYAKFVGEELTVTNNLTDISTTGANTVNYNTAYEATLTPTEGKILPDDLTITIGGVAKTKGTDYTYTVTENIGSLVIGADKVIGNIEITGTAL